MHFPPSKKKTSLRFAHVVYVLMVVFLLFVLYRAGSDYHIRRPLSSQGDHNISNRVAEYRKKMEQWVEEHPTEEQRRQRAEKMKEALKDSLTRIWG